MVRSAEAIERRAAKRNRSVAAQKEADAIAAFGARASKVARTPSSDALKVGTIIKFTWNATDVTAEGKITKISEKYSSEADQGGEITGSDTNCIKKLYIALTVPREYPDGSIKKDIKVSTDNITYEVVNNMITSSVKPTVIVSPASQLVVPQQSKSLPAAGVVVVDPIGDWVCTKCNNKNFATRPSCNRCGEDRGDLPVSAAVVIPSSSSGSVLKTSIKSSSATPAAALAVKIKQPKTEAPKSSSWKHQEPASAAQLEENQRLRDAYVNDKASLSAEDLKRAELLVKRTERRQTRKAQKSNKKKVPYKRIATQKKQQQKSAEGAKKEKLSTAGGASDSKA